MGPEERAKLEAEIAADREALAKREREGRLSAPGKVFAPPKHMPNASPLEVYNREQWRKALRTAFAPHAIANARKLLRFGYRIYIRRPLRHWFWPFVRLYQRYYAWKHRPPTKEETAEAQATLQIVLNCLDLAEKAAKGKELSYSLTLHHLTEAAYHLKAARKLDPRVTITKTLSNDRLFTMTMDYLAAEILNFESWTYWTNARSLRNARMSNEPEIRALRYEQQNKALRAAKKSVEYQPYVVSFLLQLARCQGDIWRGKFSAYRTLKRARALDPNDIDTIKMQREQFRIW